MSYLTNQIEGLTGVGHVDVTEAGVRLPMQHARLVKLENWDLLGDLATPNAVDVLWGYGNTYAHWLRAGGSTDDLIVPDQNLNNIILRTKPGETVTIFYSWKY